MPKNTRADESILNLASSKRRSLRATVPSFIVDQFDLKQGDVLRWKISGDKLVIEMKEVEKDKEN
jgi:antitoxin component of MazEF toxin-antitoxin module